MVTDPFGKEVARLTGPKNPGINSIVWDMRRRRLGQAEPSFLQRPGDILDQWVEPGEYIIILEAGEKRITQKAKIIKTIGWSIGSNPQIIR